MRLSLRNSARSMAWSVACAMAVALVTSTALYGQLTVDRSTGAVSLEALDGVNGYSVHSPSGLLDPDAWSSLADQGLGGWGEANPRPQQLSELNPTSSASAGTVALGNAYTGLTVGLSGEDISFEYSLIDGTVVDGSVEYSGPVNDFVLRVDPESGAGQLELQSENVGPFDLAGYSIFSDSGSLLPANLGSLGEGWENADPTSSALAQLNLTGSMMFTAGTTASIGNIFSTTGERDLRLQFATVGGDLLDGSVLYEGGPCKGLPSVTTIAERDACLALIPSLPGDLDGDGNVAFADFLVLSGNFGQNLPAYTDGNINLEGGIDFADFLILSGNFGQTPAGAAAAVPEPTMGLFMMIGLSFLFGAFARQRRGIVTAALVGFAVLAVNSDSTFAQNEFNTRIVVLDAANPGPNNQINNTLEARGILYGTVTDVNIAEDVTGTVEFIDFAGGAGAFPVDNPYPNGVGNDSQNDFTVQVTGFLEIPEGDWNIAINSDDGGLITMPRVNFLTTTNENGATGAPGEIIYNGTRGAGTFTAGSFTVPAGTTLRTEFEAIMFERGGGDALEVAILDGEVLDNSDWVNFGLELGHDVYGWKVLASGPSPGDFNWDDNVDFADFMVLSNNFGTGQSFAQGDNNGDHRVDLHDFVALLPLLSAGTAAVPEPSGASLLCLACFSLVLTQRRRRHGHC